MPYASGRFQVPTSQDLCNLRRPWITANRTCWFRRRATYSVALLWGRGDNSERRLLETSRRADEAPTRSPRVSSLAEARGRPFQRGFGNSLRIATYRCNTDSNQRAGWRMRQSGIAITARADRDVLGTGLQSRLARTAEPCGIRGPFVQPLHLIAAAPERSRVREHQVVKEDGEAFIRSNPALNVRRVASIDRDNCASRRWLNDTVWGR